YRGAPADGFFLPKLEPYRVATLLDDLTYNDNASARRVDSTGAVLPVERQGRYTWGYMLQLPVLNNKSQANMSVVVYDSRNPDFPAADSELIYGYNAPVPSNVQFVIGSTQLRFNYPAGVVPNIKAGQWILDGTQR